MPIPIIRKDLTGLTFGRLTVINFSHYHLQKNKNSSRKVAYWLCQCSCRKTSPSHSVRGTSLTAPSPRGTLSCGCLARENSSKATKAKAIGLIGSKDSWGNDTREYSSYKTMIRRASRETTTTIEWETFADFLNDMGLKSFSGAYVGRKDPKKPYCKDNCRWVTIEQLKNKEYHR